MNNLNDYFTFQLSERETIDALHALGELNEHFLYRYYRAGFEALNDEQLDRQLDDRLYDSPATDSLESLSKDIAESNRALDASIEKLREFTNGETPLEDNPLHQAYHWPSEEIKPCKKSKPDLFYSDKLEAKPSYHWPEDQVPNCD